MQRFFGPLFTSPLLRRVGWHLSRVRGAVDRRFFLQLLGSAFTLVLIAAALITVVEKPLTFSSLGASVNWGIQTVLGQGDSSFVTSPVGWVVGWFFSLFGVAIIGTLTGALVALVIDFLLKEGQGLGASGYRDHIVVCGWNQTARDLIDELRGAQTVSGGFLGGFRPGSTAREYRPGTERPRRCRRGRARVCEARGTAIAP